MQNIFLAGHNGMVGSALQSLVHPEICFHTADRSELEISNKKEVASFLVLNRIDSVVVAAAKVGGIGANASDQYSFLCENLEIQNGLIEGAHKAGIKNLVFLGSSCIYPRMSRQPISETELLSGPLESTNEGYALAKIAGIKMCQALASQFKLNYFSLMPTNLYGPNDNYKFGDSHVPAALMRRFHEAKLSGINNVVVWGTGQPMREFMHVNDLASAIVFFLNKECRGELINIGTGSEISIKDFAELMAKIVGYEGKIDFDTSKPDGTPRKLLDIEKAKSFGWKSTIKLEEGLIATYEWFRMAYEKRGIRGY